jgi:hypothetical protein
MGSRNLRPATRAFFAIVAIFFAALLGVGAYAPPASAASCYDYPIDCTSPLTPQMGASKPCDYYAFTAVAAQTQWAGANSISVQLRYSAGGSGASCGSAWARVSAYTCVAATNCDVWSGANPYAQAQRTQPQFLSTGTLSDIGNVSRQVKDCCGGFLAKGGGKLVAVGGGTVVSIWMTNTY